MVRLRDWSSWLKAMRVDVGYSRNHQNQSRNSKWGNDFFRVQLSNNQQPQPPLQPPPPLAFHQDLLNLHHIYFRHGSTGGLEMFPPFFCRQKVELQKHFSKLDKDQNGFLWPGCIVLPGYPVDMFLENQGFHRAGTMEISCCSRWRFQIFFIFTPTGKSSNWTNIFQRGWNHQLVLMVQKSHSQPPGLGCKKPCKSWDQLPNWLAGFLNESTIWLHSPLSRPYVFLCVGGGGGGCHHNAFHTWERKELPLPFFSH